MFAVLVVEREPLRWEELPAALQGWLVVAGGYAFFALAIYFFYRGLRWLLQTMLPGMITGPQPRIAKAYSVLFGLAALGYGVYAGIELNRWMRETSPAARPSQLMKIGQGAHLAGGICALLAVLLPIVCNLPRWRCRRIWALAKLSFKEALRSKVLWGFSLFLIVLLFGSWFLTSKPEDQVRTYVRVVFWAMSPLLLLTAGLLAAFSIPADLRHQTLYTIVTKPVERFEIVLGRCLGYVLLMSLVLGVLSLASLVYVARDLDHEAKEESYKARVPLFGDLEMVGGKKVGREWGYRSYIGGGATNDRAVWSFAALPAELGQRVTVPCEFTFDIFRTTKGRQNRGIRCSFTFENWQWDVKHQNDYTEDRDWVLEQQSLGMQEPEVRAQGDRGKWPVEKLERRVRLAAALRPLLPEVRQSGLPLDQRLAMLLSPIARMYGLYELKSKEITDYHTLSVTVPAGLFQNLPERPKGEKRPALRVSVRCEDPLQYLGVARHDLYLLDAERLFELNFLKGAIGLWCRLCVVIVVAVTLSTYLSGVISFLTTMFLYLAGLLVSFVRLVAEGKAEGGGPLESFIRLGGNKTLLAELDRTPTVRVALLGDEAFRFVLRPFINMLPDVERFDLTNYVAQGFDISVSLLLVDNVIPMLGYLIPWIVLAFYLMRSREVAA